ncbi:hypothetical protein B484DRAFT_393902 [Ochromonadaceae sp. CCMP2298]|nr:hypothetical protein B484DRAFT_393902 [Ochromonadaceae sp. CCMP2298]
MSGRGQRGKKASSAAATDDNVDQIRRSFSSDNRRNDNSNDEIMRSTLDLGNDISDQPMIIRNAAKEQARGEESDGSDNEKGDSSAAAPTSTVFKCTVRACPHNIPFQSLAEFINHHVAEHPDNRISKKRCEEYHVVQCYKCRKTDVPRFILEDFDDLFTVLGCSTAIACLERGDKENHLHLQAAAQICWNREDPKALAAYIRAQLQLSTKCPDLTFKIQAKIFERGQTWLAMLGYCQKSDYIKDKFVLDINNILKAAYAHWTAATKPQYATFDEVMLMMLRSGEYVVSGKLLSSAPLDKGRTQRAWETLLQPYETSWEQVYVILYGSSTKPVQHILTSKPRYTVDEFAPSAEDADVIPYLQHHLVKRRYNFVIIGPAGCDDIKRLLDREFDTQRIRVRYHDAQLTKHMTRIILCNSLPECFDDDAVPSARKKFRGTHLNDDEDADDIAQDDVDIIPTAWSYGANSRAAKRNHEDFESNLTRQAAKRTHIETATPAIRSMLSAEELTALKQSSILPDT